MGSLADHGRRGAGLCSLIAALLLLCLAAGRAEAGSDEPFDLRYRFSWAGVPIAVFELRHVIQAPIYQTELAIETTGLAGQLFGYRSLARATGSYGAPDRFSASRFRSTYTSHRKSRRILIRFDPDTGDVVDLEITKRGEPDPSKVPEALQKGVIDPLTALIQLRRQLAAATAAGTGGYTAAVFDGRRRFDLEATVSGRGQAEIAGHFRPMIRVEIDLRWIAGSNQDDMEPATAEQNHFRLELLLSDDDRRIPLRLRTLDSLFTAQVEVVPECLRPQGCEAVSG